MGFSNAALWVTPKLATVTEPHFKKSLNIEDMSNSELSVALSNFFRIKLTDSSKLSCW